MRYRLIATFVIGEAFFYALPIYAPPIVLQTDEIPRFLLGVGTLAVAGMVLHMAGAALVRFGLALGARLR